MADLFKLGRFAAGGCGCGFVGFLPKANEEDEFEIDELFTGGWVGRRLPFVFGLANPLSPKLVDLGGENGFICLPVLA